MPRTYFQKVKKQQMGTEAKQCPLCRIIYAGDLCPDCSTNDRRIQWLTTHSH